MAALEKDTVNTAHLVQHDSPRRDPGGTIHPTVAKSAAPPVAELAWERSADMPHSADDERGIPAGAGAGAKIGLRRVLALAALACMWTSAQCPLFLFGMVLRLPFSSCC